MGSVLVDYNHAQSAIPFFQESLELYRELGDDHTFAMVLNDLARSRIEAGQLQKGWDEYSRLKQIAEQTHDRALLLLATMNMAETARRREDYATAISFSETAISLAEALHDLEALPLLFNNLGLAYEDQQKHKDARRYFWASIHAARRCHDHEREANALSSLGSMAMRRNRLTSALSYYDRALKVLDDHDKDTLLTIQQNRLQCFIGLWVEDEVEAVTSQIINLSQELCDYEAGEDAARRTAFAYLTHGNYDAAAEAFVYSLALSSYRGSTDTYINLAVFGQVLDDGEYPIAAREQLLQLFESHLVQILSEPSAQIVLRLLEDVKGITPEE